MRLKSLEIHGFKSFGRPVRMVLGQPIVGVVGPNGSGKSNVVEAIRFALGEQSVKSLRGGNATDLIFHSGVGNRNASFASVSLTFDNTGNVFRLPDSDVTNFEDIIVKREIDSAGIQKYSINGAIVRMRDIVDLIASVNIGSSGHHIISQGEADRFLFSSNKERRILLEEALGLKSYHNKIAETERKLARSTETLREATLLQRELEPQLRFLKKQVEKINEATVLRQTLANQSGYFRQFTTALGDSWSSWIATGESNIQKEIAETRNQLDHIQTKLEIAIASVSVDTSSGIVDIQITEQEAKKNELLRMSARSEYILSQEQSKLQILQKKILLASTAPTIKQSVELTRVQSLLSFVQNSIQEIVSGQGDQSQLLNDISKSIKDFQTELEPGIDTDLVILLQSDIGELQKTIMVIQAECAETAQILTNCDREIMLLKNTKQQYEQSMRDARSDEITLLAQRSKFESQLQLSMQKQYQLDMNKTQLESFLSDSKSETEELVTLIGDLVPETAMVEAMAIDSLSVKDSAMQKVSLLKRTIERSKIRLEELGIISAPEIVLEYTTTTERYQFLSGEISDSEAALGQLQPLLSQLRSEVQTKFLTGIQLVNHEFGIFFTTMFGGGSAQISVIDIAKRKKKQVEDGVESDSEEETESEQGIDIQVKIPNKKSGDLSILSGGERSLTSIALLFALSQVNPPPFIVLDETDAALDESNSRRYGQLIKQLSKLSQIIVVTHNRETMSHCDVLYGVTLGSDSASQLFGVQFSDALQYAK